MNRVTLRRIASAGLLSLGVAALGACSAESPAAPEVEKPSLGFIPNGGVRKDDNTAVRNEAFKVCKVYSGTVGPDVVVTVDVDQLDDGDVDVSFPVTIKDGECWLVWEAGGNVFDEVTVTEAVPAGYDPSYVVERLVNQTPPTIVDPSVNGNSVSTLLINQGGNTGVKVTFTNTEVTGCTLTQGYWKTHSLAGPAPYDDGWLAIGAGGSSTLFFNSTRSWLTIFNTPPSGGNAYLQLAHQYMAAKLNVLNGAASTPAVTAALAAAETYFAGKASGVITETNATEKATIKAYASTLGRYNEGGIGPGHCDELEPIEQ